MVTATAPGTTVPVKISRNGKTQMLSIKVEELDLDAEQTAAVRGQAQPQAEQPKDTGFGMGLQQITPDVAKQLNLPKGKGGAVVADVTPGGPALLAGLQPGDVILSVNNQDVSNLDEATRALERIAPRRSAGLLIWRSGHELFVQMRKR
jgi:serine protease Do